MLIWDKLSGDFDAESPETTRRSSAKQPYLRVGSVFRVHILDEMEFNNAMEVSGIRR